MISIGKCEASSHSITWGDISPSANSRMLRRSCCCSSVNEKSTVFSSFGPGSNGSYSRPKIYLYSLHEGLAGMGYAVGKWLRFWSDFGVRGHVDAALKPGAYTAIHQAARFTSLLGSCSFCFARRARLLGGRNRPQWRYGPFFSRRSLSREVPAPACFCLPRASG